MTDVATGVVDRPILFSAPMVRAILAGLKTQTRRMVKPQPIMTRESPIRFPKVGQTYVCPDFLPTGDVRKFVIAHCEARGTVHYMGQKQFAEGFCKLGRVGDRLWVRETCSIVGGGSRLVAYRADAECGAWLDNGDGRFWNHHGVILESPAYKSRFENDQRWTTYGLDKYGGKWRPSIHMPRWASRISLEITGVRVEPLTSISREDAMAEGVDSDGGDDEHRNRSTVENFRVLWESINGKGSWETNPWVWVIEFERVDQQRGEA